MANVKMAVWYPAGLVKVTEKAVCFISGHDDWVWLPKSQIKAYKQDTGKGINYKVELPVWLANEKGLFAKGFNGTPFESIDYM